RQHPRERAVISRMNELPQGCPAIARYCRGAIAEKRLHVAVRPESENRGHFLSPCPLQDSDQRFTGTDVLGFHHTPQPLVDERQEHSVRATGKSGGHRRLALARDSLSCRRVSKA